MTSTEPAGGVAPSVLQLHESALFLVWGPPSYGPRSRVFAEKLGIQIRYIYSTKRRGLLAAIPKYGSQAIRTIGMLFREAPTLVFVQSPPTLAVMAVWLYCSLTGSRFVVDAHSGAMQSSYWTRPRWLYRSMARGALTTIVTNDHFARILREWRARPLVVQDIPTHVKTARRYAVEGRFNVMLVNTFASDEPLQEVMTAAMSLEDVVFYVTGDTGRGDRRLLARSPGNVRFTGFLPDESYYGLMTASQVVMCLTTRNHTMQRGACEALWAGKPIITSKWPILESYFHKGTVYVNNTAQEITEGVRQMMENYSEYVEEIEDLKAEQQLQWDTAVATLAHVIYGEPCLEESMAGEKECRKEA